MDQSQATIVVVLGLDSPLAPQAKAGCVERHKHQEDGMLSSSLLADPLLGTAKLTASKEA